MTKGNVRILSLLLFVCVTAVSFAACGTGGAARLQNPLDFFQRSRENMQSATSFRISGEMTMEFSGGDTSDEGTFAMDYDMAFEQKEGGEPLARIEMSMKGVPGFETMEGYITGDRMYLKMPDGMWVYQKADFSSNLADMSQGLGPQYFREILDMAESAEVVAEDGDTITYDLVLDFEKVMQQQGVEEMKRELEEEGISEEDLEKIMEMAKQIFSQLEYKMTVDKQSGLATRFQMYLDMDFASLAEMFPDNPPPSDARMIMDADFEFSDYGESFDIQLPEETEDAIPMKEYEKLVEG